MQLTVVRHARALPEQGGSDDFHRPLSQEGRDDAKAAALRFKAEGHRPDVMISSPAVRAFETARIFAQELGFGADIGADLRLYPGGPDAIAAVLNELHAPWHVLVFGHNPGLSDFARRHGDQPGFHGLAPAQYLTFPY